MISVALAAFKFIALGTATALGIVAALTRTRDEATHKITRGGRTLVTLIIMSGMLSAVTQSVELYLANKENREDRAERLQEYEVLYDLTHPLGDLRVHINATYPITVENGGVGATWLRRVRNAVDETKLAVVLNDPDSPLRPSRDRRDEQAVFDLLVEPEFDVSIDGQQTQSDDENRLSAFDDLSFRTTSPTDSKIYVHLDQGKVDSQIKATAVRLSDKGKIRSWRDLYGATVMVEFPRGTPLDSEFTRCTLSFSTSARFSFKNIDIPSSGFQRTSVNSYPYIGCKFTLTEDELGPMPELLD